MMRLHMLAVSLTLVATSMSARAQTELSEAAAGRFVNLALACVHREYPNKISHTLAGDADVRPPRELSPAFYGCYDWHSAVHGHWLLARAARLFPAAPFAALARAALDRNLTAENITREVTYLRARARGIRTTVWARMASAALGGAAQLA